MIVGAYDVALVDLGLNLFPASAGGYHVGYPCHLLALVIEVEDDDVILPTIDTRMSAEVPIDTLPGFLLHPLAALGPIRVVTIFGH